MNNWDGVCVSGVDCVCGDEECKDACWITTLDNKEWTRPELPNPHDGETLAKAMGDLGLDPFDNIMERTLSG
jgi:hypothetical protein